MRRQITRLAAIAAILAGGTVGRAQELAGTPQPVPVSELAGTPQPRPVSQACNHCGAHGSCLSRLWNWLTYHPLPVPKSCQCCMCELTPTPPLYMYFIGEYGPRSPNLGYPVWDHGLAYSGPAHCGH